MAGLIVKGPVHSLWLALFLSRGPDGPALVLLNVIERNPAAVIEALRA